MHQIESFAICAGEGGESLADAGPSMPNLIDSRVSAGSNLVFVFMGAQVANSIAARRPHAT